MPQPRPKYDTLTNEIDKLIRALDEIVSTKKDDRGDLEPNELAEASASLRALRAAKVSLECTQNLAPYSRGGGRA